jgi:hypothetical protein
MSPDLSSPDAFLIEKPDGGSRGIKAPEQIEDPDDRVSEMITSEQGKARVQRGLVDPYFSQLSRALAKGWNPEAQITEKGIDGFFKQFKKNFATGTRIYTHLAEKYGESGSPLGASEERRGAQTQFQATQEYRQKMQEAWKETRRALVRITQGPGGVVQHVELVQSSNDPSMDAEIIRELTQGELNLPAPPPSGLGIRTPIRSVWAFDLVVSISPPAPTITGSFDELTGKIDFRRPLDRRIFKHVELVSVD